MPADLTREQLKALDAITYDLNYLVKKIRSLRNSEKISKTDFIAAMTTWTTEVGNTADKLEDYMDDLYKSDDFGNSGEQKINPEDGSAL